MCAAGRHGFHVSVEYAIDSLTGANSESQIQVRVNERRVPWTFPLLLVTGRSALIFAAQALVALVFLIRGTRNPWLAAAPWWTVYGTLVDVGCLALLWRFTRAEGISIRGLIGPIRLRGGRDLLLGVGIFLAVFPLFAAAAWLSAHWLYGTS